MRLPDTSTTLSEIFVQGLYHKKLFSDNRGLEQKLHLKFGALANREGDHQYKGFMAKRPETWPWRVLISLYVLGDYLDAHVVRIAAVDAMILRHEKSDLMTFDDIDFAFANTSPDSKLRELLVHITTYDPDIGSTAREDLIGMPNEFLVNVSMTLSRRLPNRQCQSCYQSALSWSNRQTRYQLIFMSLRTVRPGRLNTCYYHEHSTEEEERDCAARVAREKVLERREQDRNRG
ncbi:hypothetical protein D6D10_01528 [Aureobasidium pullulans]|uniref:Uncharacterized protein n=1 Tax=Aureobasidium pullulans TaxID=5580 RepID=A0A4V4J994_AURPU|nr:hypothetical protein D6D10_01528 [Aureobasidium pullulans]